MTRSTVLDDGAVRVLKRHGLAEQLLRSGERSSVRRHPRRRHPAVGGLPCPGGRVDQGGASGTASSRPTRWMSGMPSSGLSGDERSAAVLPRHIRRRTPDRLREHAAQGGLRPDREGEPGWRSCWSPRPPLGAAAFGCYQYATTLTALLMLGTEMGLGVWTTRTLARDRTQALIVVGTALRMRGMAVLPYAAGGHVLIAGLGRSGGHTYRARVSRGDRARQRDRRLRGDRLSRLRTIPWTRRGLNMVRAVLTMAGGLGGLALAALDRNARRGGAVRDGTQRGRCA